MRRLLAAALCLLSVLTASLSGGPAWAASIDLPAITVIPGDRQLVIEWDSVDWPVEREAVSYTVRAVAREHPSWLRICNGNASYSLPWPSGWGPYNPGYAPGPRLCTVQGLVNGWTYDVYLDVLGTYSDATGPNVLGTTAPSTTTLCCTVASGPTDVVATPKGRGTVEVTWGAPDFAGGALGFTYIVRTVPASSGCRVGTTSCTLRGLAKGRTYQVQVVAQNPAGNSPPTASSPVRVR